MLVQSGKGISDRVMRKKTKFLVVAALFVAFTFISNLQAQPLVSIETVTVGDAGNTPDVSTGYGAVADEFNIGKYEVTIGQYTSFLNAVAATDPYLLYNPRMTTDLNVAGITRAGSSGSFSYSVIGSGNRPISYVSWFDAARFANWVNNGAINGASTEAGAYTLNGATTGIITKNPGATWWIPSEAEWFKAAYYKGGGTNAGYWLYPTQSDAAPSNSVGTDPNQANYYVGLYPDGDFATGGATLDENQNYLTEVGAFEQSGGFYGTFDQGGNVIEWNDAGLADRRGVRGGFWADYDLFLAATYRNDAPPNTESFAFGFRVATVPEPSTYALLLMTAAGVLWFTRKRRPIKVRALIPVVAVLFAAFAVSTQPSAQADTFGSGGNIFAIQFGAVGNTSNLPDTTGYGAVPYEYRIGLYEISGDQVAAAVQLGLSNVNAIGGGGPAVSISWLQSAAFANWLNTSSGYQAAYNLNYSGGWNIDPWSPSEAWQLGGQNHFRNKNAYYFLPSESEWYKAAYHKNDGNTANYWNYPTASDSKPTKIEDWIGSTEPNTARYDMTRGSPPLVGPEVAGGASPYGTRGQGGNVVEYLESAFDGTNDTAFEEVTQRGGTVNEGDLYLMSTQRQSVAMNNAYDKRGFRVASVPEPSTYALLVMAAAGALWFTRKRRPIKVRALIPVVAALFAAFTLYNLQAQPLVNIETVTIGDPGNAADTTGYGAVADVFAIGKYEVTIGQYNTFLNTVASVTSDSYIVNLWSASMTSDLNIAGISRSGSGSLASPYSYSVIGSGNRPISYVSWFDAARFANWVNNGAINGASTETGAYTLNGATSGTFLRNPSAIWFLPNEDEWVKSAYYKSGGTNAGYWRFPTASDTAPGNSIGGLPNQANARTNGYFAVTQATNRVSDLNYLTDAGVFSNSAGPYGAFDQAGNAGEWTEGITPSTTRILRGGFWGNNTDLSESSTFSTGWPYDADQSTGFRVASVPEPSTYALLLMTAAGALWFTRKLRSKKARTLSPFVAVAFAAFTLAPQSQAQPLVAIDTVTVGDAGNTADTTGYGAVADVFAIGKYEVTIGQYTSFLNAVAATDPYLLYNPRMTTDLNVAGIAQTGSSGSFSYSVIGSGNHPIPYVNWFDAARFANWMNNGATNGASTETGAYTLNGATNGIHTVNPGATWSLPSEDQWYKAAYYKGGGTNAGYWLYPTQSDTAPGNVVGGAANQANYRRSSNSTYIYSVTQSPDYSSEQNYLTDAGAFSDSASAYDTFDQGGNVYEWNDAVIGSFRGIRGGSWDNISNDLASSGRSSYPPEVADADRGVGFRLATVPEPSTYALLLMTGAGALWMARRRR